MISLPHIIEIALLLLVVFLIGCVIGFTLRNYIFPPKGEGKEAAQSKPSSEAPVITDKPTTEVVEPPKNDEGRPSPLDGPRQGRKDNLKLIKGIGPKIESTLNEMGIYHFDQIAAWDRKTIDWADENLSFKGRIDREEWVQQAIQLTASKDG